MRVLASMGRNALGLGLFALLTVGMIALTETLTRERIAAQQKRAEQSTLLEVVGAQPEDDGVRLQPVGSVQDERLGLQQKATAHVAMRDGSPFALITPIVAPDGYSGRIKLLLAVDLNGEIVGVRVLQHRETPGLGDRIELRRSDWILDFNGRSVDDPPPERWTVRQPDSAFDAFTGATITPRAVVGAVHRALQWHADEGRQLLEEATAP